MIDFIRNHPEFSGLTDAQLAAECNVIDWQDASVRALIDLLDSTGELGKLALVGSNDALAEDLRITAWTIHSALLGNPNGVWKIADEATRNLFAARLQTLLVAGVISVGSLNRMMSLSQRQRWPEAFGATEQQIATARAEIVRLAAVAALDAQIDATAAVLRAKLVLIRDTLGAAVPTWAELLAMP